jgi:hypothetical protein
MHDDGALCDHVGACPKDAFLPDGHGDCPPSPTSTQNTTIWPSQFKCQDLSCSIACNKLKPLMVDEQSGLVPAPPGSGNSLDDGTVVDDMTVSDQPEQQSTAAVAATLASNYFNMNPRVFDLNELDLDSGEWNWDLNDVGFLGLFKLGDTAPAAATTTTTATSEPPPAPSPATPTTNQHANIGSCESGKRVKQLEILHEHLQHEEQEAEKESSPRKKKKKQK